MNKSYKSLFSIAAITSILSIFIIPICATVTLSNSDVQFNSNPQNNSGKVFPVYKGTCDVNPNLPGC